MPMIQKTISRRFSERARIYRYRWLPDCILYPKLDYISRFRAPYSEGFRSHYLKLTIMYLYNNNYCNYTKLNI